MGLAQPSSGLSEVVLSMGRSYASSAEVRMKGDIDDVQIRYRGQLYRRITIKPHIPLTAARRSSRRPALAEMLDAVTAGHEAEAVAWHNQRVPT